MSNNVDICDGKPCTSEQESFFANYINKENFISVLAKKLMNESINAVMCSNDAATTMVKVPLKIIDVSTLTSKDNMRKKKDLNELGYRVHDIIDSVDSLIIKFILLAHAFTGCDTTSAIQKFVKLAIFLQTLSL